MNSKKLKSCGGKSLLLCEKYLLQATVAHFIGENQYIRQGVSIGTVKKFYVLIALVAAFLALHGKLFG